MLAVILHYIYYYKCQDNPLICLIVVQDKCVSDWKGLARQRGPQRWLPGRSAAKPWKARPPIGGNAQIHPNQNFSLLFIFNGVQEGYSRLLNFRILTIHTFC